MNQLNPITFLGAFVTVILAAFGMAASLGALFWRMRAAEARIRVLEKGHGEALELIGTVKSQLTGLDATIKGLTSTIETLSRRIR